MDGWEYKLCFMLCTDDGCTRTLAHTLGTSYIQSTCLLLYQSSGSTDLAQGATGAYIATRKTNLHALRPTMSKSRVRRRQTRLPSISLSLSPLPTPPEKKVPNTHTPHIFIHSYSDIFLCTHNTHSKHIDNIHGGHALDT